jgi:hypothetical protein
VGTFRCNKCGALVDLLWYNRHVCGAPGPAGGYADRPDGRNKLPATWAIVKDCDCVGASKPGLLLPRCAVCGKPWRFVENYEASKKFLLQRSARKPVQGHKGS